MMIRRQNFETFEKWCVSVLNLEPRTSFNLSGWHKKLDAAIRGDRFKTAPLFQQDIMQLAASDKSRPIYIEFNAQIFNDQFLTLDFSEITQTVEIEADTTPHILTWVVRNVHGIDLTSAICGKLDLRDAGIQFIKLRNCRISILRVGSGCAIPRLHLQDCWIGTLHIDANGVQQLSVEGGTIRSVRCPTPDQSNPLLGSVTFHNVKFPTKRTGLLDGAQGYRNLRAHMEKLQNSPMAALMRVLELRTERQDDRGLNRFVNLLYDFFADYGLSPGRPLRYIVYLYLLAGAALLHIGGGVIGLEEEIYTGWRENLVIDGIFGHAFRSFYLPLQSIINPFSTFGPRSLLVPTTLWGKGLLIIQGIGTYLLLLMTIFGIRKRFKIH